MKTRASESRKNRPSLETARGVPELTRVAKCCGLYLCECRPECVRLTVAPDAEGAPGTKPADGPGEGR